MTNKKSIGVLTSGGDSPGMNAAVRAVVRTGIYFGNKIFGIKNGYQGMIDSDIEELNLASVSNVIKHGGTFLKTSRCEGFYLPEERRKAYDNIAKYGIESLIVIGGDGSFRGLHTFATEYSIQCIGIPATIDNDLYGTDYTIGFDTSVNTALEAIDKIRDTATSHSRIFIIEVMGRNSGYIGLYTGISGGAEEILIPETVSDIEKLCKKLEAGCQRGKKSSIIVVAEGDEMGSAYEIKAKLEQLDSWNIKVSVLGHQQRGGSPTALDRILASRLGYEAILAIMNGENDKMVGIVHNNVTITPLEETWTKKKVIDNKYIEMAEILAI